MHGHLLTRFGHYKENVDNPVPRIGKLALNKLTFANFEKNFLLLKTFSFEWMLNARDHRAGF